MSDITGPVSSSIRISDDARVSKSFHLEAMLFYDLPVDDVVGSPAVDQGFVVDPFMCTSAVKGNSDRIFCIGESY